MNEVIDRLNIDAQYKHALWELIKSFNVESMYCNMLKTLLAESNGIISLSSYTKSDYLERNKLIELHRDLQLKGNSYDMILLELQEYRNTISLDALANKFPMISVEVLELIYVKPDYLAKLITGQLTEYNSFNLNYQKYVTEYTIYLASTLLSPDKLITFNYLDMFEMSRNMYDYAIDKYMACIIAKRVCQLQKTLHQLRGTKLCIIDTETTDLKYRLPVQISYILTDLELNVLNVYDRYVIQSFVDPDAERVHGISVHDLRYNLCASTPTEALNDLKDLFENDKVIFVAHNAQFDVSVIKSLYKQCNLSPVNLNTLCTYKEVKYFGENYVNRKLASVVDSLGITGEMISAKFNNLFENNNSTVNYHRASYDVTALYLMLQESRFLKL